MRLFCFFPAFFSAAAQTAIPQAGETDPAYDPREEINAFVTRRSEGTIVIEFPKGNGAVATGIDVYDKFENDNLSYEPELSELTQ